MPNKSIYPYEAIELEVEETGSSGGVETYTIHATSYEVRGRGAANRQAVDTKTIMVDLAPHDLAAMASDLVQAMVDPVEKVSVVGGPSTQVVMVKGLPPMTREAAAGLIGQLVAALV